MSNPQTPTHSRRWFQFGTRGMLLLIAVAGVVALFISRRWNRAMEQRRIVETVLDHGGTVSYDFNKVEADRPNVFDAKAKPPGAPWLRKLIGDEHFQDVVMVDLAGKNITDDDLKELARLPRLENLNLSNTPITNRGLEHLKELPNLRYLSLWKTNIDDDGVKHLAVHKNLYALMLDGTKVTDVGLAHLQGLTELEEWLGICDTQVTDEGIQCLSGMTKLKQLNVRRTNVTAKGAKSLRRSLPSTEISHGP